MNIEFKCPQCRKSVSVDEAYRGQVVRCPHCTKGIVVPKSQTHNEGQRQEPIVTYRTQCPYCGCYMEYDAGLQDMHRQVSCETCGTKFVASSPSLKTTKEYICTNCGETTTSPKISRAGTWGIYGFFLTIVIGLLLFALCPLPPIFPIIIIIIGIFFLIYSIICMGKGNKIICPTCGKSGALIPVTSQQGKRLLKEMGQDIKAKPPQLPSSSTEQTSQDMAVRLKKARDLLDGGLISMEEYKVQRKRILDSI